MEQQSWDKKGFHWYEAMSSESGKSSILGMVCTVVIIWVLFLITAGLVFMTFYAKDLGEKNLYVSCLIILAGIMGAAFTGLGIKGIGDTKIGQVFSKGINMLPSSPVTDEIKKDIQ